MAQSVSTLRNILYFVHVERQWYLPQWLVEVSENGRYDGERYLQHDMGRTMSAVGRIEITRQAGGLAVRANIDVYHRTINTMETSANNVLLTTAHASKGTGQNI